MVRLHALGERLRASLWFVPVVFAVGAAILALILVAVDRELVRDPGALAFAFGGTPEGARSVLSTIAQSMLTFTALVFTITMLVLQLASSQLSPRVMRTFLRDVGNQIVLGLFVATFLFTLLVLREVRGQTESVEAFVPGVSVWVAFLLLLASLGAFIYYIDHMAHAIRASAVIENIWRETVSAIDRLYPERVGTGQSPDSVPWPTARRPDVVLKAPRAGVIVSVDEDGLLQVTEEGERLLELLAGIGDFVPLDGPLARLWGRWDRAAADDVRRAIGFGRERTLDQDVGFGLRQLVDVALRALSPGMNDPTTAVQALDRIHDLLRRLAVRDFPSPLRIHRGRLRLVLRRPDWDAYLRLALDEIRLAAAGQLQVNRRLRDLLADLAAVAPPDRQPPIEEQLARLEAGVRRSFEDPLDRARARRPDGDGRASTEARGTIPS